MIAPMHHKGNTSYGSLCSEKNASLGCLLCIRYHFLVNMSSQSTHALGDLSPVLPSAGSGTGVGAAWH